MAEVRARSTPPWLHIAECVVQEATVRGHSRVVLTGARHLTEGDVYPADFVRPQPKEREPINGVILDELVYGQFRPGSLRYFQGVIGRLPAAGCQRPAATRGRSGCTEIPLLVRPGDSPLPVLDSTRLLARAALKRAAAV